MRRFLVSKTLSLTQGRRSDWLIFSPQKIIIKRHSIKGFKNFRSDGMEFMESQKISIQSWL